VQKLSSNEIVDFLYSQFTLSVSHLDVTEYLKAVTEKDPSGKTVRSRSPAGMPTHYLPSEGVCLVMKQSLMTALQKGMDIRLEVAIASVELSIFLYDNVYDGVNLTELAFDRMPELLAKVHERVETCDCQYDCGCIRCIADPMRESPSSKVATLFAVRTLQSIFTTESPATTEFLAGSEFGAEPHYRAGC
jgi:Domain of unknown function (DUF1998)